MDIKTLETVRAQGTSTGTSTTTGWVQGIGNAPGQSETFHTTTRSYTDVARSAAPPGKRFNGVMLIVTGVAFGGILGWLGYSLGTTGSIGTPVVNILIAEIVALLIVAIGAFLAVSNSAYNRDVYPDAYARWSRSWQCQRCGTVFAV